MRSPTPAHQALSDAVRHEIRFQSLFDGGRALSFPCDASGQVQLALLSERARKNYLYARATVGREYATPFVSTSASIDTARLEQGSGIAQVDRMTQQNGALVEQSAAAADSLKQQVHRLAEAVAVFGIGASPAAA